MHDLPSRDDLPDVLPEGTTETWQDIAGQYRADHRGPHSVVDAVDEILLELAEALSDRSARESSTGELALSRRTQRYRRRVHELYSLAETVAQAQMAASVLELGAPAWLYEREDGRAWHREIVALNDYASWAVDRYGRVGRDGLADGWDGPEDGSTVDDGDAAGPA
ncbi:hypothetical protein [Citricoccus sp. K5]|uniref:hypothetical protein n=1 Tax=Citricoccus sp. K5 TaxID=2653135 RepID=UPI00135ABFBC|nr:hypothetical protein [Citricoccus sp. K5]